MTEGVVVWITGLPSAGKSTLATRLVERLAQRGKLPCVLDGDEVRAALVPEPGYDDEARKAFYGTLGNLALLLARQGHVVLVPATSNRATYRERVRARAERFIEVFVDVDPEECARRDAKGLYARARQEPDSTMPGMGAGYDVPRQPDVTARGGRDDEAVERIVSLVLG